jgi:hypothetical protein
MGGENEKDEESTRKRENESDDVFPRDDLVCVYFSEMGGGLESLSLMFTPHSILRILFY